MTTKREKTIHDEKNAAICFFTHLQSRGKTEFSTVSRFDVLSFFFDGEKPIRGHAYISKFMPILKHAAYSHNADVIKVIEYLPNNAIWRYITTNRPKGKGKEILSSNRRTFERIGYLWGHIKNIFNEADVRTDGARTGIRIFRHHLATSLLANEVASPVISSILGHASPDSLNPYIDEDIEHLRECALDVNGYPIAEEVFEL